MSGNVFNSTTSGDWGAAGVWSTDSVPDAVTADVTIGNNVTIGATESFTAGAATVTASGSLDALGALSAAALDVQGGLGAAGTVTVAGTLTVASGASIVLGTLSGFPPTPTAIGTITAADYVIDGTVNGVGTLAGTGTLISNGNIFTGFMETVTVAPQVFLLGASGTLNAFGDNSTLEIAPGTFANLSDGILTGGGYTAGGGTLELPGPVDAIVDATLAIPGLGGTIEAGGAAIQSTLHTIGDGAALSLSGASLTYTTANTLTVDGGTIDLGLGTLSAGGVTLVDAASTLSGAGQVTTGVLDNGLIALPGAGTLAIDGAVTGDGSISVDGVGTITADSVALDGGGISIFEGALAVANTLSMTGGSIALQGGLSAGTLVIGPMAMFQGGGTVTGAIDNAALMYANISQPLDLAGPVTGAGSMEIAPGSSLQLAQASSQSVSFDPVGFFAAGPEGGELVLDQPGSFTGTITGFGFAVQHETVAADTIELVGVTPGTLTATPSGNAAETTLTVQNGASVVATLFFAGDYVGDTFTLAPDGGNTAVELATPPFFSDAAAGDWSSTAVWSPGTVPDSASDYVLIDQHTITIASGESFTVGTLDLSGTADFENPFGIWGTLDVAGTLNVPGMLTAESSSNLNLVNGLVTAGSIDNTSNEAISGAGTLSAGGTLGGQVFANVAGETLTVEAGAFNGGLRADGAGATLLLSLAGGAGGFQDVTGGDFTRGVMLALQGGTLVLPGTISSISGSSTSTPEVTLAGAASEIIAGGERIEDSLTDLGFGAQLALNGYDFVSPLTLTVGGFVWDANGFSEAPATEAGTLAPAAYQELASGEIDAAGTMVLAPGTFMNLSAGTLSIGSYGSSGTLELPGTVNEIDNATIDLTSGEILAGGVLIQNSLSLIVDGAELSVSGPVYATANTLTVDGGTIALSNDAFTAAGLTLAAGASVLQGNGGVSAPIDNAGRIIASGSGLLDLTGTVSGAGSLEIASGSTLQLALGNSENVAFDPDSAGVLILTQPNAYAGTLLDFANSVQGGVTFADAIDLPDFAPGTLTDIYNGTTAGGVLTLQSGGSIVSTLNFAGPYTQNSFTLVPDTGLGTFIEAAAPPIFESSGEGDWSVATIWNPGTVPNSAADYVLLETQVKIAAGESFTAGTLEVSEVNLFAGVGETSLEAIGTLDAAQLLTIDFDAELALGAAGQAGLVTAPSLVSAGTIAGLGTLDVGSLSNSGLIDANGGLLDLAAGVSGSGSLELGAGGTLELAGASNEAATFEVGGVLKLDQPGSYTGTIFGFAPIPSGDAVDLVGVAPGALTKNFSDGTLTIENGASVVASLDFASVNGGAFTLEPDGSGGTDVELNPCYASGTRIATPRGEVAVEALREGDTVLTSAGRQAPIVWIGQRRSDCARQADPRLSWPVRIRAGAFGPAEPLRDLCLSPDHAVFRAGALIPARYLVNGSTIVQEPAASVHYFHVELPRHAVLLAEGLPCESYLDTGNRTALAPRAAMINPRHG